MAIRPSLRESMGGNVPLSEHEQRQLEQIEQALYAEHPRFARAVRASDPRVHYRRRVVYAAIGFLIGLGLLVAGVATKEPWLGVAGLCRHARLQYVGADQLPPHGRHHGRARAGQGPPVRQAGGKAAAAGPASRRPSSR